MFQLDLKIFIGIGGMVAIFAVSLPALHSVLWSVTIFVGHPVRRLHDDNEDDSNLSKGKCSMAR